MNKALHHPDTIKVRLRNQSKRRTPNATKVPDRPQLGSTTDQLKQNNTMNKIFIDLLLELGCVTCTVSSAPANWFCKYLVSHEDSAISHPRDQDYLSLWEGWSNEVELQQVTSIYGGYNRKREREEKAKHGR